MRQMSVVVVREYPHVDVEPRAMQLAEILADAIAGIAQPTMARFDCRVVGLVPTVREPMRGFVDQVLVAADDEPGVLAASLGHGFPYLDAPGAGACALVVSNARRSARARRRGPRRNGLLCDPARRAAVSPIPLDLALDDALSGSHDGPVVLADMADNAGGGAPSDSTFVLAELLRRGVRESGVAPLWDPGAVRVAFAAELGSTVDLRLGGKSTRLSGDPLDVTARVKGLCRNLVQRWPQADGFAEMPLGDAACLDVEGIDVVVVSLRDQAFGLELFTAFGIDPAAKRLLVLKSANHFRAAYDPIASDVVYVDAGGTLPADPRDVAYTRFDRHAFPWIDDPLRDGAGESPPSETSPR